jgi:hypothetical protein
MDLQRRMGIESGRPMLGLNRNLNANLAKNSYYKNCVKIPISKQEVLGYLGSLTDHIVMFQSGDYIVDRYKYMTFRCMMIHNLANATQWIWRACLVI